ncbi:MULTISPECIES: stage II sporulation protein P [Carboxydothermus]|uniref:Stage II sporulation protein P n=2 Tax=Carboxydothermus TaxID=129957 RepID=A0ABX2R554_9THEO|nr:MULTISPECIES: stage II sporulation protein P [Carboxydothermus]ABB15855.1 putative sporulation protein [Carboxydothermus hydrogenoformans Z-2901]NYE56301.1 stage II sporulation protein P [Carboxydothermus ferrireducens DSM 11255]
MEYRAKAQRGTAVSLFLLIYALLLGITATVVPPETSGLVFEGIKNSALIEVLKENLWEENPRGYLQKTLGFKQKNDEEGNLSQEYALWLLTGARVNDPYSLMLAGYPVLNGGEEKFGDIDEGEDLPALPGEPLVGIFCTHAGESYEGDGGRERAPKGEKGEVLDVARELSQKLEEKGIKTILIEKVHDTDYNRSYSEAKKTVLDLLAIKSLKLLVDVHRDSEASPRYRTVNVMGEELAPIIFVIGKGERLPQPHWQENELVTKKIIAETETIYPGLIRGIRYKSGRFNQHLSSHLVLVEIGNVSNSLVQAKKSADLLAEGIARYLLR